MFSNSFHRQSQPIDLHDKQMGLVARYPIPMSCFQFSGIHKSTKKMKNIGELLPKINIGIYKINEFRFEQLLRNKT